MSADDQLEAALRQLRAEFLADAPRRVAELWSAWARVQNGEPDGLAQLRTLVHRLAGTGSSYGLPLVTERARAADEMCRVLAARVSGADTHTAGVVAAERLRGLVQGIADAFHDAPTPE